MAVRATMCRLKSGKVKLNPEFRRQTVAYKTNQPVGTIVVNTGEKFLYLVLGNGKALRYGIGTARDGFEWNGTHTRHQQARMAGLDPAGRNEASPAGPARLHARRDQ